MNSMSVFQYSYGGKIRLFAWDLKKTILNFQTMGAKAAKKIHCLSVQLVIQLI